MTADKTDKDIDIRSLHPLEVRVLVSTDADEVISVSGMQEKLGFNLGQCNQAISWLTAKELIDEVSRSSTTAYEITGLGTEYAEKGTPEERILALVREGRKLKIPEIASGLGLDKKDAGSAFGTLSKEGAVRMDGEKRVVPAGGAGNSGDTDDRGDAGEPESVKALRSLLERAMKEGGIEEESLSDSEKKLMAGHAKKRGASSEPFRLVERETVEYRLNDRGKRAKSALAESGMTGEEIGAVTPELLESGEWKGKQLRAYNIQVPPTRRLPGRKNPYAEYLVEVKDRLVSLGFEEFDGPLVETEFWNGDALFMPQFHSARDIHDVYYVENPGHAKSIEQPWLDQVAAAHENGWDTGSRGWGYEFDRDFTRRLVLRSQGTVLSAKQLPKAKVPGKYFGVVRCFRYDQVDATHGADFYQTEGIVLGEEVNLRTLLGLLKLFAVEVAGATDFRYVPGYFPFTEPSIEVHIKHPVLGWFELGGSGIFRPEVTKPLGVEVPVLAWGLGIDRMALMQLGLDDLRELFSNDIERVRMRRRSWSCRK